jgi:gas vesicle protein
MNKTGKIITAFTIGSAAGAFLGLLMAPDKKKDAIKKMKEKNNLFPEDLTSKYLKGKEKFMNREERMAQKVNGAMSELV